MADLQQQFTFSLEKSRFEWYLDDIETPVISTFQQLDAHTLNVLHTEVPLEARGKGIGSEMVRQVLEYALTHTYRIIPTCPVVGRYLQRHPEYRKVLEPVQS